MTNPITNTPTRVGSIQSTNGKRSLWENSHVHDLIVKPLEANSVALIVSNVIHPEAGNRVEIPVITDNEESAGWTAPGAEAPVSDTIETSLLTIEHYKLSARVDIPWETNGDANYDVRSLYGDSLRRKLTRDLDAAYFDENSTAPVIGLARTNGLNTINATGKLKNLDIFLDCVAHAEDKETKIDNFVCSINTRTALAKLKKQTGSEEPLLGTVTAPAVDTLTKGIPLRVSKHVPDGIVWAIPKDAFVISMLDDAQVLYDHESEFSRMTGTLLAYARFGFGCIQPSAISKVTLQL